MTLDEFRNSMKGKAEPPPQFNPLLKALWYEGKGDWETAHNITQDISTDDGSWIHAYLHRKEGDQGNAAYWYHRARKPLPKETLEKEWEELVVHFLESTTSSAK